MNDTNSLSDCNLIKRANALFAKGEFAAAYELYQAASKVVGTKLVSLNLALCEKRLNLARAVPQRLDSITSIALANSGEITLTEVERKAALLSYNQLRQHVSKDAEYKPVRLLPRDWPANLKLAPLPQSTNDFLWYLAQPRKDEKKREEPGLSIIIPTFNRSNILDITLAALVNQETRYKFEVIVADDGSHEDLLPTVRKYEETLDIKYVRQKDYGYQLCAVRNLGLRTARYAFVAILDCDMAPSRGWVESYIELLLECDDVALIGPRKYINTEGMTASEFINDPKLLSSLPEVKTNNVVAGKTQGTVSVDWRLSHFAETEDLRLCDTPFRYFSGGNVAFARKWLDKCGWFDEEFTHWGGEDNEFGYRLYRAGCFFRSVQGALAYHQEPPGKENETDRAAGKEITIKIVEQKVPYFYRKLEPIESAVLKRVPLVSIYIPAFNCANSIVRCVESALRQTVVDLEVCICDDGSTDSTLEIIQNNFGKNPRVRFISQPNRGIGAASNAAVRLCRGYYIGQLDSDDYLEPDAVEQCLKVFLRDRSLACVYTTNRNVDAEGQLISNGYNWPEFSREKFTTAMICHHFRMFTARAWNLTSGFNESITNAVDYDMYLKLSEVGPFSHINKICYNRVLHGENTSIKKLGVQKINHFKVVNDSLHRQGLGEWEYLSADQHNEACREYVIQERGPAAM